MTDIMYHMCFFRSRIVQPKYNCVCGYHPCFLCAVLFISVCYVFPINPLGFLLTWRSNEVEPRLKEILLTDLCRTSPKKDKMFSRFSETAKNSPFATPFSAAKCSSESTPAPRRTRIMASPNTDGRF